MALWWERSSLRWDKKIKIKNKFIIWFSSACFSFQSIPETARNSVVPLFYIFTARFSPCRSNKEHRFQSRPPETLDSERRCIRLSSSTHGFNLRFIFFFVILSIHLLKRFLFSSALPPSTVWSNGRCFSVP